MRAAPRKVWLMQVGATLPESDKDSFVDKSPADEPTLPSSLPVTSCQGVDTRTPNKFLDNEAGAIPLRRSMTCAEPGSVQLSTTSYFGSVTPPDIFGNVLFQYLISQSLWRLSWPLPLYNSGFGQTLRRNLTQ